MTASANFDISANDRTKAAFDSVEKNLKELGGIAVKAGAIAGTAISAVGVAITGLTFLSASNAKEMTAYARAIGISTSELSAWGYASETVSVSQEKLNDILKDTSEKIGDAYANKGGEAVEILERLNLSAKDMAALSPDQQLLKIAGGLDQVGTQSEKVLILESLASDASLLIPLLDNDAEKLKFLRDEAHELGISLNDIDAAKIDAANKAWTKTLSIIEGVGQKLAAHFSPYIEEIANQFGNAAKETNGFVGAVEGGMKTATMSVAYLGDVIRGLEVSIKIIELAFAAFAELTIDTVYVIADGWRQLTNLIPGLDIGPMETFSAITKEAGDKTKKLVNELDELVSKPMPSGIIEDYFNMVDERATASAEKVAAVVNPNNASNDDVGNAEFDQGADLERLLESYESEYVLLEEKYANEQLLLDEAYLAQEISTEKHEETMAAIAGRYAKARESLDKAETKDKTAAFQGMFGDLTSLMDSGNKEMFEIGKAAAISNTVISTYSSAQKAYDSMASIPYVGPVLGGIAAAAAISVGMQRVSAIQSTSFGGSSLSSSSSSSSGGGAVSAAPVTTSTPPPVDVGTTEESSRETIIIEGVDVDKLYSGQQLRDLAERIAESDAESVSFV